MSRDPLKLLEVSKRLLYFQATGFLVIVLLSGSFASAFSQGARKLKEKKITKLKIESIHYASPGAPTQDKTTEFVELKNRTELYLSSEKFNIKHRLIALQSEDETVEISQERQLNAKSGFLLHHKKEKNDLSGFSIQKPTGAWKNRINREQILILVQAGIQGGGVQWKVSID